MKIQTARFLLVICLLGLTLTACQLQPPISIGQRESKLGQGIIVLVTNTSDQTLNNVRIRVEGPDGSAHEYFEVTVAAKQVLEVGWLKLDGWPVPPGAKVEVSADGYSMTVKATL